MEFSRLNFKDRWEEERIQKLFRYTDKNFNPLRKDFHEIDRAINSKVFSARTEIRYYDLNLVIDSLKIRLSMNNQHSVKYGASWKKFISELEGLRDGGNR